jgi:hypothetical protein
MALSEDYLKSVSESELKDRAFTPFELQKHERDSMEEIKKLLKENKYTDKNVVQESLDFIESLSNRMSIAINNEKKEGKSNWELESDLQDVKKVFDQLNGLLQTIETKEVDAAVKKDNSRKYLKK